MFDVNPSLEVCGIFLGLSDICQSLARRSSVKAKGSGIDDNLRYLIESFEMTKSCSS